MSGGGKLLSEISVLEESLESKGALQAFQKLDFERVDRLFLFNDRVKAAIAHEEARLDPANAAKAAAAEERHCQVNLALEGFTAAG